MTEDQKSEVQKSAEKKLKKELETDYPLIPMSGIEPEARMIAVAWAKCDDPHWIENKHKLASDIMNYARRKKSQLEEENKQLKDALKSRDILQAEDREEIKRLREENKRLKGENEKLGRLYVDTHKEK